MSDWSSWFEFTIFDAIFLVVVSVIFFYWLTKKETPMAALPKELDPLPMEDMTVSELARYNGVSNEHILFGLNGTIYDVSKGRQFYGPGKAYGKLAGHDATRALGTMNESAVSDKFDDHEDLTASEKETAGEWESQFRYKYQTVGRLIRDTDKKANYGAQYASVRGDRTIEDFIVVDKKND